MAAIEARILRIKGVSPTKWGSATAVTEEDGISERYVSESCEIDEASENGLYKKGTEVDVFSPPKIEGEGRKANSDVVHEDVDGSETSEKGSEPVETELVDKVIDGNEVGDDDGEEDEDSSFGGEDKVGDDPSRDVVPVKIGTEDGGKYNKSEQRSAPSLPLEKGIYFSESSTASELFCSHSMCVADVLSPDNIDDWRKIQIGEKEGPLGHAHKVLDGMPLRVSATKSHSRAYKVGGKLSVFNPRPSGNLVKLNTGENVLNVDAGNEKGNWLSGKQDPKVANCDNFVGEHHMLDEMLKQGRVDKPHKMGLISDSRSDEEGLNAIGKYERCTKDTRKIQGVEKVAPMSHALKVFDGKHKPSALVVDQERKWADVVAGAQSKGPAANQTQESISKGMELEYISDNGSGIIDIEDDMIDEKPWIYCVVGYFLGPDMPFGLARATARSLWGRCGLVDVFGNNNGFFFFQFQNFEAMEYVLDNGPWLFSGRPIFLKKWKKCLSLTKESHKIIPVWVKFHDLPLEFWNAQCLSRISSAVGVPLYVDKATKEKRRISYARVCVEIAATNTIKESVHVRCGGEILEVNVEYQGLPPICSQCKVFGHVFAQCKVCLVEKYSTVHGSQEEGSGEENKQDSLSDSSTEWTRVTKRKNIYKKRRKEKNMTPTKTYAEKSVDQLIVCGGRYPRQGTKHVPLQSAVQPVVLGGWDPRRLDDLACCYDPPPCPASQASLLIKAIEGSG